MDNEQPAQTNTHPYDAIPHLHITENDWQDWLAYAKMRSDCDTFLAHHPGVKKVKDAVERYSHGV